MKLTSKSNTEKLKCFTLGPDTFTLNFIFNLSGTIPKSVGALAALDTLALNRSPFSGTVPHAVRSGALPALRYVDFYGSQVAVAKCPLGSELAVPASYANITTCSRCDEYCWECPPTGCGTSGTNGRR